MAHSFPWGLFIPLGLERAFVTAEQIGPERPSQTHEITHPPTPSERCLPWKPASLRGIHAVTSLLPKEESPADVFHNCLPYLWDWQVELELTLWQVEGMGTVMVGMLVVFPHLGIKKPSPGL